MAVLILGAGGVLQVQRSIAQDRVELRGRVTAASTGNPLVGATVVVEGGKAGTSTNEAGRYELSLSEGTYTIVFNFVGYRNVSRTVDLTQQTTVDVELEPVRLSLEEVVVTDRGPNDQIRSLETGISRLNVARLERLPTFMGSPDIIRGLLSEPGVSSVSEGAAGFNVRGGNVGQNLILFNGTPVYFPSHLFGLFSPFNADVVSDVTLHKSSIPPRYGGRASSVLRVNQKVGSRQSYHLRGGVSPITSRLFVEGPIQEDNTSFVVSGRLSYVNWLLGLSQDPDANRSEASFYDVNLGINHRFRPSDEVDVMGYRAFDDVVLSDTTFSYATSNASIAWKHLFSERLFTTLRASMARYDFSIRDSHPTNAFLLDSGVQTLKLSGDLRWNPGSSHSFSAGITGKYHDISPGTLRPTDPASEIRSFQVEEEYGLESALYLGDRISLTNELAVDLGLRLSMFNQLGPDETPVFGSGASRDVDAITDTVSTERGELGVTYFGFEPRLSLRYSISETNSIKVSYDRTHQYVHLLSNSTAVAPTDVWHLSSRYRKPQIGDQVSMGYFQTIRDGAISSSFEVFYKWMENVPAFKPGTDPLLNTHLSTDLLSGEGRAYGLEVLLEKPKGRYNGRISYSYSRTGRKVTGSSPSTRVNGGRWYPASHDRPHALVARFSYRGSDPRAQWNFKFTYRSGRAITYPSSKFVVDGIPVANVSGRNQARVPPYHRLDVSLRLDLERRKKRGWNGSWTFSVYNVYARRNVSSVFFGRDENGAPQAYRRSVLGTIFPSLTYTFEY